jgi:NAD(P)-dependent dehydrogenase (short-subunit alcohol dehydrogenase family)
MVISAPTSAVLVTGGASGIGAAVARAVAGAGRPVLLWDLDDVALKAQAEAIAADLAGGSPGEPAGDLSDRVLTQVVDVRDAQRCTAALAEARATLGPIGGFVHCAGVVDSTPMTEVTREAWQRVIDVNLTAFGFLVAELADDLRSVPGSAVVGIGSINAVLGQGAIPSYSASKAGVLGLVRSLAAQLGPSGVRVNAICPGYIATPMLARVLQDESRASTMSRLAMLQRVGEPAEVGAVARFLLSSDASFVTGTAIHVDGGVLAHDAMAALA